MAIGWLRRAGTLGALAGCLHGAVALGASPAPARATARFVYLPGPGADPCADEATLRRAVVAKLGRDPFRDDAERTVAVSLERNGPDLAGRIELRDRAGKTLGVQEIRSRAANCAELAAALELTVSMVLEARAAASLGMRPAGEASTEVTRPISPQLAVSFGALVALAAAPSTVAGGSLGLEARWPRCSVGLEGRLDAPATLPHGAGYLQSSLWMAMLVPCLRHRWLGACVLLAAGVQQAEAVHLPGGEGASALYLAPGARLALAIPLGSVFAAQLRTDVLVPVAKASLYTGLEQVWVTPPASFAAGVALEAQISR